MKPPGRILLEEDIVVTVVITTEGTFIISQEGRMYRCEPITESDGKVPVSDETTTPTPPVQEGPSSAGSES